MISFKRFCQFCDSQMFFSERQFSQIGSDTAHSSLRGQSSQFKKIG